PRSCCPQHRKKDQSLSSDPPKHSDDPRLPGTAARSNSVPPKFFLSPYLAPAAPSFCPSHDARADFFKILATPRGALPDHENAPAHLNEIGYCCLVPRCILFQLCFPKRDIRLRSCGKPTFPVPVPEASMHKNRHAAAHEHDVRRSRQVSVIQSVSE